MIRHSEVRIWMRVKQAFHTLALIALLTLIASFGHPVAAQSYSFAVPELKMQVYVQPDASVHIIYDITFENYGSTIDVVDIGTPNDNYDIGNMRASINGVTLSDIRPSEYIATGVEIHLAGQSIPDGSTGTLHFEFTMPDLVYQDTTNKDNASLQITPTWFDSDLVVGTSDIQIAIHMLEGIHPDEVLYQDVPFTNKALYKGCAVALWQWQEGTATMPYRVGVSFPKRGMTRVITMTFVQLVDKWLQDNPEIRFILGTLVVIMFAFLFFRFSGGTGFSVFVILTAGLVFLFVISSISVLLMPFVVAALILFNELSLKGKKKDYLPAIAQVEGGGIKRGLTAPEAAVLIEMPLSKVLTLVIFGLLEKGIVTVTKADPLTVTVNDEFRVLNKKLSNAKERRTYRRQVAQAKGTVIHKYEDSFLSLIEHNKGKPVRDIDFSKPVERLIKTTTAKMKGFDLSDTQEYYRRVIDRAMKQAASLGEIEAREKYLDKYLPWVMMNESYPTVLATPGHSYWPVWVRLAGGGRPSLSSKSSGRPAAGGRTTFGDVGASFAGWAESTMGGLAASILPSSLNIPAAKGGFVDLSGADRVTGDIFSAMAKASSSSGSSGGGSSCACACAGCACACACAGGGR